MPITAPSDLTEQQHDKIFGFLRRHPVGVLASVNQDGSPNASTIYFSVDDDLNLMFTTKLGTKKHANISQNNNVMIVIFDAVNQSTVQASGIAIKESDAKAAQAIYHGTLQAAEQTGPDVVPPIAKIAASSYVAYIIKPANIWMTEYGWGDNFAKAMKHADDPDSTDDPA